MSMMRTALRLATVLALNNNYKGDRWPTEARDRVFDSRNEPPERQDEGQFQPEITVFTLDDEAQDPLDYRGRWPMRKRTIDLVIECAVCAWRFDEDGQGGLVTNLGYPETDAQMEAKLDLLEFQVKFALSNPLSKWASLWGGFVVGVNSWTSGRWAGENQTRTPIAQRVIKLSVELLDDCSPEITIVDGEQVVISRIPKNIQALIDAVDADVISGEPPHEYVSAIADMLRHSDTPSGVTMKPFKKLSMRMETGKDQSPPVDIDVDLDQI